MTSQGIVNSFGVRSCDEVTHVYRETDVKKDINKKLVCVF